MKNLSLIFLISIILSSVAFAQTPEKPKALKVDESGRVGEDDLMRSLDNFFVTLHNNSTLKGVIIAYRGTDGLPAEYKAPLSRVYQNYIYFRNFDASRIEIIDGGFRSEQTTEFWTVPQGAVSPKPTDTIPPPETPKNRTFLYDRVYMEAANFFLSTEENQSWINEISEELSEWEYNWVNKNFAEKIKEQMGSRGVIIYYADDEHHNLNNIQAHLVEAKKRLAKEGNIAFESFDLVFGGFSGGIEFELWIVPKNGEFPTPSPKERFVEELEENTESL